MALESRITQEEIKKEPEKPIDREKVDSRVLIHFPAYPVHRARAQANSVALVSNDGYTYQYGVRSFYNMHTDNLNKQKTWA